MNEGVEFMRVVDDWRLVVKVLVGDEAVVNDRGSQDNTELGI